MLIKKHKKVTSIKNYNKELLKLLYVSEAILLDSKYSKALIGYSDFKGNVVSVYDMDKCIKILAKDIGPSESAVDFFHNKVLPYYDKKTNSSLFVRLKKNI